MNYAQLKQQIQNNLWYGENSREQNYLRFLSDALLVESVSLDGTKIFGVDISHWNTPPVDLKGMVELYNLQFVIIKGCDGSVNTKYYFEHVAAAKAAGVPWGMYVWLYPASKVNIDAQVNAWHARAQLDPPPLGIFIDAEWTYYGGAPANPGASDLRQAHDKIKVKQGKPAITYTAKGYADTWLIGFEWDREELWVANYGVTVPAMPRGALYYILHQFTSTWNYNGVNYDGNYFNGTAEEFAARYGITPPPIGGVMLYGKINTTALNVRAGYNSTFPIIGQVVKDDYVMATETVSGWWHLTEAYRGSWNGAPVALNNGTLINDAPNAWCSGAYILAVDPPVPPPPPPPPATVKEIKMTLAAGSVVSYMEDGIEKWKVTA